MLVAAFPKLERTRFVRFARAFFRSYAYPALAAVLMAVSELFAAELPVYYIYLALGGTSMLLCEDTLGGLPVVCCGYMTFSAQNNPGRNPETTVFTRPEGYVQLFMIIACSVVLLLGRFVLTFFEQPRKRVPRLTLGFVALGAAYMLGGAFSGFYAGNTVLYGFVQIVSVAFFYFFFYYSVDWGKAEKGYLAALFLCMGVGMLAEVAGMYFLPGAVVDGKVVRSALYTGWGVYNNVGCIMAMCMPSAFYFAATKRFGWLYTILGCLFFAGVVLTQSRGAILFGTLVFIGCAVFALAKAKGMEKLGVFIVLGAFVFAVTVSLLFLREQLSALFGSVLENGIDDAGRVGIYKKCWKAFLSSPAFGNGFYHTPGGLLINGGTVNYDKAPEGVFIPPRAHNTFLQLLASGGVFAVLCYVYHRTETMLLFFRRPTPEKTFAFLSVAALLLTSLLDCNFFNIGPGILYAILLAYAEGTDGTAPERRKTRRKRENGQ